LNAAASTTVHAAFARSAAKRGDAEWLIVEEVTAASYRIEAGPRSWGEVAGEVERLRGLYQKAGYGHGHRVGLLLENRPAFFTHWLALNGLGVSIVPIHADMRAAEWMFLIGHSEMSLAVALPGREAALRSAASEAGVSLETIGPEASGRIPPARTPARLAGQPVGRNSECALLYTSGTTGRPKGCRLSNGYFLRAGDWYLGLGGLATVRADVERFLTPLPLSHMNALAFSTMASILTGGSLVQLDRFHPVQLVADGARHPRHGRALPRGHAGDAARGGARAGSTCSTRCASASARASTRVHPRRLRAAVRFPAPRGLGHDRDRRRRLHHGAPRAAPRRHALLRPREAFVEARIVDEKGLDTAVDVPGELLVRAAGPDPRRDFFLGYLKDVPATEAAWADGWFHTGDVVRRTAAGDFHFVDRRKNVIRRSGENISAVEVESVLNQHPAVEASAVAATPDPVRGDEVLACIVLRQAPEPAAAGAHRAQHRPLHARPAGLFQGARLRRLRRQAAADGLAEGAARRAARAGAAPAGKPGVPRLAHAEAAQEASRRGGNCRRRARHRPDRPRLARLADAPWRSAAAHRPPADSARQPPPAGWLHGACLSTRASRMR
jgi:acyl-CoA synthetase (AMP-forming)/AMP-acid ligase II